MKFLFALSISNLFAVFGLYAQTNIFPQSGNVGIGTSSPSTLLDIYNNTHSNSLLRISGTAEAPGNYSGILLGAGGIRGRAKGGLLYEPYGTSYGLGKIHVVVNGTQGEDEATLADSKMTILSNGNVGIGTLSPAEKLSVNGKIRAHEIKVELANWPDYVFNSDHVMLTLSQVKAYIVQNHHLPELPSAQQVSQNGLNLGEITKLLTKKIEELTLYLIEKDNQLKMQEVRLNKQQSQIKNILMRLEK